MVDEKQSEGSIASVLLTHYANYHNHKETMAYSIFALEGAFFLGLLLLGNWPPSIERMDQDLLAAIFVITWVLFHFALRFQLRNRKLAAIKVAACIEALSLDAEIDVKNEDYLPKQATRFDELIDAFLLPTRNAFRTADIESSTELERISPGSLQAIQYFELKNKRAAQLKFGGYAIPIEWVTSVGSIFLLSIALLRVYAPTV